MNPSNIFGTLAGAAAHVAFPVESGLYDLGKSAYGALTTPKQQYTATLASSAPSASLQPSGQYVTPRPTASAGGNAAATAPSAPKTDYINSQTGTSGTMAPTAPTTNPSGVNANYAYQGLGATPPGNVDQSSPQYQYQQAFNTYLQSLQPTDAETNASKSLADLQLQASKDNDFALDKPGQTTGFASGEAARVNRNNQYGIDAASNSLNALTSARTARTNATQAQLDFEKGLYDDSVANAKPDYTTVSPGSTVFDQKTGKSVYTAPTTASQNPDSSAGSSYVAGTDPTADGWVTAINNGQATLTQVPAAYKNIVAQGLAAAGKDDALKTTALTTAQQLLKTFQNSSGILGTGIGGAKAAVGASSILPAIPGTQEADFLKNLDQLKSLLSLDNVKYLKGQGAVSDAERKLLADSATQLSQSQSEGEFEKTLNNVITQLGKFGSLNGSDDTSSDDVASDPDYQAYLKAIGQ